MKNVPLCFLLLLVSLFSINLQNNNLVKPSLSRALNSSLFFFLKNSVEENCMFYVFRSLLAFQLLVHSFSCRSSKMTSFPLYVLLLFILFPSVLSLFLSLLVFSFPSPFSPFQTSFCWSLDFFCVSSCQTLCKNCIFSLFHQNLSFLCFFFFLSFLYIDLCSTFFVFFRVLKNGFSFCFTPFNFFNSVSLHLLHFYVSEIKNCCCFLEKKTLENSNFCFWSLGFKNIRVGKIRFVFPLLLIFSLFVPLFFLSSFWSFFLFHHCCLCLLFPFIFLFISSCFSPIFFSLSFFSLSHCFSHSFFLSLMFPYLFFHRRFCVSSFGSTHFSSLFCSWSHSSFLPYFFFVSVSFLLCQTKYNIFSFFFEEDCFLNFPFFLCLISCFSSLRRPYSLSVPCFLDFWAFLEITFLDFLFIYLRFGSLQKIVVVFGHNSQKISLILVRKSSLGRNPCFRDFDIFFAFDFFHAWSLIFPFLSFSCKYLVSFVLNLFVSVQKKKTSKNKIDPLYFYVYSPCSYSSWVALVVFILSFFSVPFLLFCLFMFPLLMFIHSPYVSLFSLMFLLFVCSTFFLLTLFIIF